MITTDGLKSCDISSPWSDVLQNVRLDAVMQESVTNVIRHAHPTGISNELHFAAQGGGPRVSGDGLGFDAGRVTGGIGLPTMRGACNTRGKGENRQHGRHAWPRASAVQDRGHELGGCNQEEPAAEAAGGLAENGVGRVMRALRRICALSYRLAYKEYPDRMNWDQAQEAIKRVESIAGPIHKSWRIRSASRETFYVESRHAGGLVDRRTGEFTITWSKAEKIVRWRMRIGYWRRDKRADHRDP
jgi:hypothetical protein